MHATTGCSAAGSVCSYSPSVRAFARRAAAAAVTRRSVVRRRAQCCTPPRHVARVVSAAVSTAARLWARFRQRCSHPSHASSCRRLLFFRLRAAAWHLAPTLLRHGLASESGLPCSDKSHRRLGWTRVCSIIDAQHNGSQPLRRHRKREKAEGGHRSL